MRPATERRKWLTSEEAAEYLGLSTVKALYGHITQNRLPYGRVGRLLRFDPDALDTWVESRGTSSGDISITQRFVR